MPPREHHEHATERKKEVPPFVVGEIVADGAVLEVLPKKAGAEPLHFDMHQLRIHSAGTAGQLSFTGDLTNARAGNHRFSDLSSDSNWLLMFEAGQAMPIRTASVPCSRPQAQKRPRQPPTKTFSARVILISRK